MRLNEISSIDGVGVSYEEALREAVKVKALTDITKAGMFSSNTAQIVLGIAYPGRSMTDRLNDWNKAYKEIYAKEKFKMNLKIGNIE